MWPFNKPMNNFLNWLAGDVFIQPCQEQSSDRTHTPTPTYTPTDKLLNQPRVQIAYLFHAFELESFLTQSLLMVNKTTVYTDISLYLQDPNFLIAWTTSGINGADWMYVGITQGLFTGSIRGGVVLFHLSGNHWAGN